MTRPPFPNEPAGYRAAREALLAAEIELRAKAEEVAALRRRLPTGGPAPRAYAFEDVKTGDVQDLPDLFGDRRALLLYSFMFGPDWEAPCPMCATFLDGLDAAAVQVSAHAALAVSATAPAERLREVAAARGWRSLRLLSEGASGYARDYGGQTESGGLLPMMNVWRLGDDGAPLHFWASEMLHAPVGGDGQEPRHLDVMWPLWNLLDLTPEGRGAGLQPA